MRIAGIAALIVLLAAPRVAQAQMPAAKPLEKNDKAAQVTVDGHDKGVPFGGEYRFLRVFAKQSGEWKVVLAQGAPMPDQSAAAK